MAAFTKKISIMVRLAGFVGFLLLLLIGAGIGGLTGMQRANQVLSSVYQNQVLALEGLREMEHLVRYDLVDAVDKVLFDQLSWDKALQQIEQTQVNLKKKWDVLFELNEAGNDWLAPARPLIARSNEVTALTITLLKEKNRDKLDALTDEKLYPLLTDYLAVINTLAQERLGAFKGKFDNAQIQYSTSKQAFVATLVVAVLASLLASYLLIRGINLPLSQIAAAMREMINGDLTRRVSYDRNDELGILFDGFNQMIRYLSELVGQIQLSGIQVTSSVTEIAATIKQQEASANEHAATTSEIAASTTEIAATSANLMETMKKVTRLTQETAQSATEGHAGLANINKTMAKMETATSSIVDKLSILSEKAGNIAGVVKTINKIADQTNLLSLNAAIEAEKAGEYGAGFAVVATEIRRLADQTAVATYDIEQMVQDVQSAVSSSVMGIDKFAEDVRRSVNDIHRSSTQLGEVINQVQTLMPQVETVNEGIAAQSLGARQISEAISQLNDAARKTAASIAQTGSTIFQLNKAALILQDGVSRFKVKQGDME